jgi:hypothetical protein
MLKSLWAAGLLVVLLSARPACADTLHYVVNGRLDTGAQGVVRETPIPILLHLLCEAKGNSVTLTATDQLSIRTSCEANAFDPQRVPTRQDLLVSVNYETDDLWGDGLWVLPYILKFSNGELDMDTFFGVLHSTQAQMLAGAIPSSGLFHLPDRTAVTVSSVPEPSTLLLFGTGLVGLWVFRRFKRLYVTRSWS